MWLDELQSFLGDALTPPVFIAFLPEQPDDAVAIYDAGGDPLVQGAAVPWSEHRFEVRVRATTYASAGTIASTIYALIDHKAGIEIGSEDAEFIRPLSAPFLLERDKERRVVFMIRAMVALKRDPLY